MGRGKRGVHLLEKAVKRIVTKRMCTCKPKGAQEIASLIESLNIEGENRRWGYIGKFGPDIKEPLCGLNQFKLFLWHWLII